MSQINQQTAGPITEQGGCLIGADTRTLVAGVHGPNLLSRGDERRANRALLAAAYTSYDRAGRELGVDAATLAQSIDLEEVIRYALDYAQLHSPAHDKKDVGRLDQVRAARKTLGPLAALMGVELPE